MDSWTHEWPSKLPDLNPFDFYFWGYIKQKGYKRRCPSKMRNDFRHRLDVCIQVNDGFLKH